MGIVTDIDNRRDRRRYIACMHRYEKIRRGAGSVGHLTRRLCAGVFCLTAAAGLVQGEIYKSIDANGHVVYSDHLDPSLSQSTVVQLEESRLPPHELHFCWTNCFSLVLDNGVYRRADGSDETWTVETFSADAIVLHRHDAPADWNGYSQDVVYAGRVANDRLIGVTVDGKPISGVDASWGSALNTLPGSNAERDADHGANPNPSSDGSVSSAAPPPPLREEAQPALTQDGSLWTPGYWYWRQGYFWIPGAWVRPPQVGVLWTPPYWGLAGTLFVFHPGHWGSTVGFYGGVNYGYGYFGNGYSGGHWIGNSFAYNSAVNHVDPAVAHHMYAESPPNQGSRGVLGYTGGPRSGTSPPTAPPPPAPPRLVNKPAATVQPISVSAPTPVQVTHPAPVKAPAPSAAAKHVTATRAEPVK